MQNPQCFSFILSFRERSMLARFAENALLPIDFDMFRGHQSFWFSIISDWVFSRPVFFLTWFARMWGVRSEAIPRVFHDFGNRGPSTGGKKVKTYSVFRSFFILQDSACRRRAWNAVFLQDFARISTGTYDRQGRKMQNPQCFSFILSFRERSMLARFAENALLPMVFDMFRGHQSFSFSIISDWVFTPRFFLTRFARLWGVRSEVIPSVLHDFENRGPSTGGKK